VEGTEETKVQEEKKGKGGENYDETVDGLRRGGDQDVSWVHSTFCTKEKKKKKVTGPLPPKGGRLRGGGKGMREKSGGMHKGYDERVMKVFGRSHRKRTPEGTPSVELKKKKKTTNGNRRKERDSGRAFEEEPGVRRR